MLDYTFGPKGRRKRQKLYGFNSRAEAESLKAELALRPLDQILDFQKLKVVTVDEAIEKYLTTVSYRKASYEVEKSYFNKLKAFLNSRDKFDGKVHSIGLLDVQEFQNHLLLTKYSRSKNKENKKAKVKYLSAATVNRHFHTYRNFFEQCRLWDYIRRNPCEFLKDAPEEEKPIKVWGPEACAAVFLQLPAWTQRIVLFIAKTGARRSEACVLEDTQLDISSGTVTLRSRKGRGKIVNRVVPMTKGLTSFMLSQLEVSKKLKSPMVFCDDNGNPVDPTHLSTIVNRAARKAGHAGLNLHGLRHTILSQLAHDRVSLREIQALAGHTNLRTTQRYLHTQVDQMRSALESREEKTNIQLIPSAKGHLKGARK